MEDEEDLPHAEELDIRELWENYPLYPRYSKRQRFLDYLRTLVRDPGTLASLEFCDECNDPEWDVSVVRRGASRVCESCLEDWSSCGYCEDRFPDYDLCSTLDESTVCDHCQRSHYSYCEDCEGYYPDDDASDHDHDGCGCESPKQEFTIRNDGCEPLQNDMKVTVALPAGVISETGLSQIGQYLRDNYRLLDNFDDRENLIHLSYCDLGSLGDKWQTKEGNYTKRLSRHAYQKYAIKIPPEMLSQIGCIARDNSHPVEVTIDVTRDLNMSASDFYHDDSCWWGSYAESRCALKTNGGFGLRSFRDSHVSGRAWVLPLRLDNGKLTPTFGTPDAFVVFNGYGELRDYAPARVMAHMAGWTYRKIGFQCSPMYINAGGYLVAPEEIAAPYTNGSLSLDVPQHATLFAKEKADEIAGV